jgi:hypothetical protein
MLFYVVRCALDVVISKVAFTRATQWLQSARPPFDKTVCGWATDTVAEQWLGHWRNTEL